jgi:hypothetical protein
VSIRDKIVLFVFICFLGFKDTNFLSLFQMNIGFS